MKSLEKFTKDKIGNFLNDKKEDSLNKLKNERLKIDVFEKDIDKKLDKEIEKKETELKKIKKEKEQEEYNKILEELKNTEPKDAKNPDEKNDIDIHKKHMAEKGFGSLVKDLHKVPGFDSLTDGQKMLVAEGMNQTLLKHVENESQKRFMEEIAPYQTQGALGLFSKKGAVGLWKNMTKGSRVAKHAKEALRELKSTDVSKEGVREAFLTNNVKELVNVYNVNKLDAHLGGKDGKELVIDYAKFNGKDPEVKKITEMLNEAASNPPPHEWKLKDASKDQRKAYKEYEIKFEQTRKIYTEKLQNYIEKNKDSDEFKDKIKEAGGTPELYIARQLSDMDVNMKVQQYLIANPEATKELQDIAEKNPLWKSAKNGIKKHGVIMFVGYEMRNVLRGLNFVTPGAGEVAVAVLGAGLGMIKGGKKGEEEIRERNKLLRSSSNIKDTSPETKKLIEDMNAKEAALDIKIKEAEATTGKKLTYKEKIALRMADKEYEDLDKKLSAKLKTAQENNEKKNVKLTGIKKDIQETKKELEELNKKGDAGTDKFKSLEKKLTDLSEKERLERESKQTNAAVSKVERLTDRISNTKQKFEEEKDPAKKSELLKKLKTYVDFAEIKSALGEVNFGKDDVLYKQYEFVKNIADAKIFMEIQSLNNEDLQGIFGDEKDPAKKSELLKNNIFEKNVKDSIFNNRDSNDKHSLAEKVQRRGLNEKERAEEAQQNLINEHRRNAALMGATAALLGSGVKIGMEEITGHASSALTGVDFLKHQAEGIYNAGKNIVNFTEHPHETISKAVLATQEKLVHQGTTNIHYNEDTEYTGPNALNQQSKIISRVDYGEGNHVDPKTGQIIRDYGHKGITKPAAAINHHHAVTHAKTEGVNQSVDNKKLIVEDDKVFKENLAKHLKTPDTKIKIPDQNIIKDYHFTPDEVAKIHQAKDAIVKSSLNTYFPKHGFLGSHGINSTEWKDASDLKAEDFLKQTNIDAKTPLANMQSDLNKFVKELNFRKPIPGESLEHYYGDVQEARVGRIIALADKNGLPSTDDGSLDSTRVGRRMARIERKVDLNGTHSSIWKEIKNDSAKDFLEKEPIIDPKDPTTIAKNDLWKDMKLAMAETKGAIPTDENVSINEYFKHLETVKAEAFAEQGGVDDQIKDLIDGKDITTTNYDDISIEKEVTNPVIQNNNISIKHLEPTSTKVEIEKIPMEPLKIREVPTAPEISTEKVEPINNLEPAPIKKISVESIPMQKLNLREVPTAPEIKVKAENIPEISNIRKNVALNLEPTPVKINGIEAVNTRNYGEISSTDDLRKLIKGSEAMPGSPKFKPEDYDGQNFTVVKSVGQTESGAQLLASERMKLAGKGINFDPRERTIILRKDLPDGKVEITEIRPHKIATPAVEKTSTVAPTEIKNTTSNPVGAINNVAPAPEITHATEPLGPKLPEDYNNAEPVKKLVPNFQHQENITNQQQVIAKPSMIQEKPRISNLVYSEKKIDKILNYHYSKEAADQIRSQADRKFKNLMSILYKSDPKHIAGFLNKDVKSFLKDNHENNPSLKNAQNMIREYLNKFPNTENELAATDRLGENMRVSDFLLNAELIQEKIDYLTQKGKL